MSFARTNVESSERFACYLFFNELHARLVSKIPLAPDPIYIYEGPNGWVGRVYVIDQGDYGGEINSLVSEMALDTAVPFDEEWSVKVAMKPKPANDHPVLRQGMLWYWLVYVKRDNGRRRRKPKPGVPCPESAS